jgi:hypothetical protein
MYSCFDEFVDIAIISSFDIFSNFPFMFTSIQFLIHIFSIKVFVDAFLISSDIKSSIYFAMIALFGSVLNSVCFDSFRVTFHLQSIHILAGNHSLFNWYKFTKTSPFSSKLINFSPLKLLKLIFFQFIEYSVMFHCSSTKRSLETLFIILSAF